MSFPSLSPVTQSHPAQSRASPHTAQLSSQQSLCLENPTGFWFGVPKVPFGSPEVLEGWSCSALSNKRHRERIWKCGGFFVLFLEENVDSLERMIFLPAVSFLTLTRAEFFSLKHYRDASIPSHNSYQFGVCSASHSSSNCIREGDGAAASLSIHPCPVPQWTTSQRRWR